MFEYQTGYQIYENLLVCKASSTLKKKKEIEIKKTDFEGEETLLRLTTICHYSIKRNVNGKIIENLSNQMKSKTIAVQFHQIGSELFGNIYRIIISQEK